MATTLSVGSPTYGLMPFQKQAAMPFTTHHMYPGPNFASPETPVTASFAPPSLPTPVTSPERGVASHGSQHHHHVRRTSQDPASAHGARHLVGSSVGPFHNQPSMHFDFPHYHRFEPPTPTPVSSSSAADQHASPEKPAKRKPGRPPKSAAQKAADAAARKAAAGLKKDDPASSKQSRSGNARGRPSKQQLAGLSSGVASPAKSDVSLPTPSGTPAQPQYAPSGPLGVGAHTPPAESELKAKRRRLWAPHESYEQHHHSKRSGAVLQQGLLSPPHSSGSDASSSSPSLAASTSPSAHNLQRRIDPVSGRCVYIHPDHASSTPSLSSSSSTAATTSSSSSSSSAPPHSALAYLAQRLDESQSMVKAVVDGYGAFLIHWVDLKDRMGMQDALEAVATGIKADHREGAGVVCEKIVHKYCNSHKGLSLFASTSLEQEERGSRFAKWLEEVEDEQAASNSMEAPSSPLPSPPSPLSLSSSLNRRQDPAYRSTQGGKSLKPLERRFHLEPDSASRALANALELSNEVPPAAAAEADAELDAPFSLDHALPQSPQSVDEMRSASNVTPANEYSVLSYSGQAGGPGLTRQPTLVESSPVVRHTPKPAYANHARHVSWGGLQHELLPPFPSTPPPSGDFYYDRPRGQQQRARQVSGKLAGDHYERFDFGGPEFQSPGSFIPDITATPDRGAMARQLGLFPASSLAGVTYTPGPFSR